MQLIFEILFITTIGFTKSTYPTPFQELINVESNSDLVFSLHTPIPLNIDNQTKIEPISVKTTQFFFKNININQNPKQADYYSEFTCNLHTHLQINNAIEPDELTIRGSHGRDSNDGNYNENFTIEQSQRRLIFKMTSNTSNSTQIKCNREQIKTGKKDETIKIMGKLIETINSNTLKKFDNKIFNTKIENFQRVFPFLNRCLSTKPIEEVDYEIKNSKTERWEVFELGISHTSIRGLTNFLYANVTTYKSGNNTRFVITLNMNPLKGNFSWFYITNDVRSEHKTKFSIGDSVLRANIDYAMNSWNVNDVDVKLGKIQIDRGHESCANINEMMYCILQDHLDTLIMRHLQTYIYDMYSVSDGRPLLNKAIREQLEIFEMWQSERSTESTKLNEYVPREQFEERWKEHTPKTKDFSGIRRDSTLKSSQPTQNNSNDTCVDDRPWWQKMMFFVYGNKCQK